MSGNKEGGVTNDTDAKGNGNDDDPGGEIVKETPPPTVKPEK